MEDRIDEQLLTNYNRPKRPLKQLKGVVIHWTANTSPGANAQANRNYFNNLRPTYQPDGTVRKIYASAHYMVDDRTIIRCIPDNEVAYHVGARYYKPIGEEIRNNTPGDSPNNYLIGIEMCVNSDGDWAKTYATTVELTRYLLDKYGLNIKQVYRHYDITGKLCPQMMVEEEPWLRFKNDVIGLSPVEAGIEKPVRHGMVLVDGLNVRAGNSVRFPVVGVMNKGDEVTIYDEVEKWFRIGDNVWSHGNYIKVVEQNKVGEVEAPRLNVRKGPGVEFEVVSALNKGDTVKIFETQEKWARIGDDQWVHTDYVRMFDGKKGRVNFRFLNVRASNSVDAELVGRLQKDDTVDILKRVGDWIQIGDNRWVHGDYIDEITA